MHSCYMDLPEVHMTAGESKTLVIPIYDSNGREIDASGITAEVVISDFVITGMQPVITKDCQPITKEDGLAHVLQAKLVPADTKSICGKYIYQITAVDSDDFTMVKRGILFISPNAASVKVIDTGHQGVKDCEIEWGNM